MHTIEELLRRLALQDDRTLQTVLTLCPEASGGPRLHQRTEAIARLGALIALQAPVVSYQSTVIDALSAGTTAEELLGALVAVAPIVGAARVTAAAPAIAAALGYDVDEAFERSGGPATGTAGGGLRDALG